MTKKQKHDIEISKHDIEFIARLLLPQMQKFFESEEGKREFEEWKAKQVLEKNYRQIKNHNIKSGGRYPIGYCPLPSYYSH